MQAAPPAAPIPTTPAQAAPQVAAAPERADGARAGVDASAFATARSPVVLLTWNLDWFGDPVEGPRDDTAQHAAVREILLDAGADVIALQEIASGAAFERLLSELPGHAGVLSGYDWTQKTALLWRTTVFELGVARALTGLDDAGRPPLEVSLRHVPTGRTLLFVVVHAKAQADAASRAVRERLAQGVKAHLDAAHASTPCIVIGDFNDLLLGSITEDAESPYRVWTQDEHYAAPTLGLDAPGVAESSYLWGATIDHVIVSDELAGAVDPAGAEVLREELLADYPDYAERVSDHFPVSLRLWW